MAYPEFSTEELEHEEWRNITGFNYQVSSLATPIPWAW